MTAARIPVSTVERACESSPSPIAWSVAWVLTQRLGRLERDIARVRHDCDCLPRGPLADELGRYWHETVERREAEARICRARLDTLRAIAGPLINQAVEHARGCAGAWITVPGGSDSDG
jgi:hypothetical protein